MCVCIYIYVFFFPLHLWLICNWILSILCLDHNFHYLLNCTHNGTRVDTVSGPKTSLFQNCELDEWFNYNVRKHKLDSESESFLKSTQLESWWDDSDEKDEKKTSLCLEFYGLVFFKAGWSSVFHILGLG